MKFIHINFNVTKSVCVCSYSIFIMYCIVEMLVRENIAEFSCLDYLEEKTLVNGHQFTKFANIFSHQRFLLYGMQITDDKSQCIIDSPQQ